jgi:hypothetical protein
MATIHRRKRTSRHDIGPYRRYELLFGEIIYPVLDYTGYGDGTGKNLEDFISDEMRADWEANRDELTKFWRSGAFTMEEPWLFDRGYSHTLPWAAKHLDGAIKDGIKKRQPGETGAKDKTMTTPQLTTEPSPCQPPSKP